MICSAPLKPQEKGSDHKNIFMLTQHMGQATTSPYGSSIGCHGLDTDLDYQVITIRQP